MGRRSQLIVLLLAAAIYLAGILSPPNLMDDVDAVQAQIARNMLESGDWVTARLNGIAYLEKSPVIYWLMASSYALFGVSDSAARVPLALSVLLLVWVTMQFSKWAFGERAGAYSGMVIGTCIGLWLFTRIQIPDAILTLTITLAMWAFLRSLEARTGPAGSPTGEELAASPTRRGSVVRASSGEEGGWRWPLVMSASIGLGLLLKGLIAVLFPVGAALTYLGFTGQLFQWAAWRKLRPFTGALVILLIAAPWHLAATMANPPYLDFTMKSEPGKYHGFFWFYFFNEHVFRFLNMRHPRDYNTVPRLLFWLFHLLWLFPWSAFFPAIAKLKFQPVDRAGRTRLLALCWTGFLLVFFTFSTTQEYYSMPCYPALALLLGSAMTTEGRWMSRGRTLLAVLGLAATLACIALLVANIGVPAPGDISQALTQNPSAYTLSLGHMGDLTVRSFAYLRLPLALAAIAFLVGAGGAWLPRSNHRSYLGIAVMMVLFFHAARLALIAFDPYLGSRDLAVAYQQAPRGELIVDNQYYTFSSVFFYTNQRALLLRGRVNNLEYGSYAPGAPDVFLDDAAFRRLWNDIRRRYVLLEGPELPRFENLVGKDMLHLVRSSGGKYLFTNLPVEP